jgi:hypothetical protein
LSNDYRINPNPQPQQRFLKLAKYQPVVFGTFTIERKDPVVGTGKRLCTANFRLLICATASDVSTIRQVPGAVSHAEGNTGRAVAQSGC